MAPSRQAEKELEGEHEKVDRQLHAGPTQHRARPSRGGGHILTTAVTSQVLQLTKPSFTCRPLYLVIFTSQLRNDWTFETIKKI